MCRDTAVVETKELGASILEGRRGKITNYDAGRGTVRDWALLGYRTRRVRANVSDFWLRGHDRWRQCGIRKRDGFRKGTTL